jgi:hypothetical protein
MKLPVSPNHEQSPLPSTFRREDPPLARDAFQSFRSAIREAQARASDQILDGARHQNLAGGGEGGDAGADVDGDAADVVADHFALAGVEPGSDLDAERRDFLGDRAGATNAARGTVERPEKSVAGGFDFVAAKAREIAPYRRVMTAEQITPALVAERRRLLARADNVGHENQHSVDRDRLPQFVGEEVSELSF